LKAVRELIDRNGDCLKCGSEPQQHGRKAEDGSALYVTMPELDGPSLADQLRAVRPDVRVVFMSADWISDGFSLEGRV
jgi:hypothetical protein